MGLLIALSTRGGEQLLPLLGVALVVGIPVALFMRRQMNAGAWQNVDASRPSERPALFAVIGLMCAAVGSWFLITGAIAQARGTLAVAVMTLVAAALLRWTKLSLHMAFGLYAACVLLQLRPPFGVGLLLLMPLLAWSRLKLGRHRLSEVIGGSILGALAAASVLYL